MPNIKKKNNENTNFKVEDCGVAQLKISKYKYTWTIDTSIFKKEVGESICSQEFILGNNADIKWHIELHPKSICRTGFSTLYLCIKSCSDVKTQALYKFSVLNAKNEESLKSYDWCIFTNTDINRTPHYFNVDQVFSKISGGKNSEKLTIICKIWYTLNINESNDSQDFGRLLEDKTFSDLTLLVEGKELNVHRNILALKSPVFFSMFNDELKDKKENSIEINDIEHEVMKEVIKYIYTKKVENLTDLAKDLLVAAEKYELQDLKDLCEKSLCKSLNIDNVTNFLILSELYKASTLKEAGINFIIKNLKHFDLSGFSSLVESQPKLLAEILHTLGKKDDVKKGGEDVDCSLELESQDLLGTFFY